MNVCSFNVPEHAPAIEPAAAVLMAGSVGAPQTAATIVTLLTPSWRAGRVRIAVIALLVMTAVGCTKSAATTTTLRVVTRDLGADRYLMTSPPQVPAGIVRVVFTNRGTIPHDAQLFRVEGTHTQAEVADTIGIDGRPVPDWLHDEGGVGTLAAGQTASAVVSLPPGAYYVMDSGVDEDSIPFAKAGAAQPLSVVGSADDLPAAGVSVAEKEYSFGVSGGLTAGLHPVRVENEGQQPHELIAAPLAAGKTATDVQQFFGGTHDPQSPAPLDLAHAVAVARLDPGRSVVATLRLRRGSYVFVCLVSDRQGGPKHAVLGMVTAVDVR